MLFVTMRSLIRLCFVAALFVPLAEQACNACPFCSAVSQTFAEEMKAMDVIIFGQLVEAVKAEEDENGDIPKSTFKIVKILKGEAWVKAEETVAIHFFGKPKEGKTYLIMATDPPKLMWGSPLRIEERAQEYLAKISGLPDGAERLPFFMRHLEDEDEMLARDAYDEFARAPYESVIAVKEDMDRQQLLDWIQDADVPVTRRRLYLTMLGVCGTEEDAAQLEKLMRSENKEDRAGLNAMIASFLSLKGSEGLPVIEELFLMNEDAEYANMYAAIMAMRFHGNEGNVIPRDALLPGLRAVLERDEMADLVIPDLARWEDWTVIDRLGKLFKNAKPKSNWVRVPVINYLRACPLPEAEEMIASLKKVDPEAVERANTFFPYTQFEGQKRGDTDADGSESEEEAAVEVPDAALTKEQLKEKIANMSPKRREEEYGISRHVSRRDYYDKQPATAPGARMSRSFFVVPLIVALVVLSFSLYSMKREQRLPEKTPVN